MATYQPTDEQIAVLDSFRAGRNASVKAYAGAGKTSTLVAAAAAVPNRRGIFTAFNKKIITDSSKKFGRNVKCATTHSLATHVAHADGGWRWGRMKAPRLYGRKLATLLAINEPIPLDGGRIVHPSRLASLALMMVDRFANSGDDDLAWWHLPAVPGLDDRDTRKLIGDALVPAARRAWADVTNPRGVLRYTHNCQPPGTLVRRVARRGGHFGTSFDEVPIEQIAEGDYVVSFAMSQRRGYVRRQGSRVNAAGSRHYDGQLVKIATPSGRTSSYTLDHHCVVRIDTPLSEGNYVVYMQRRGNDYRIGRTTWRTGSQGDALGVRRRADNQGADAYWILSVHSDDETAALHEALTAHEWGIPTWQFRPSNPLMPIEQFWMKVGDNTDRAAKCLAAHGRSITTPFWQRGSGWQKTRRPVVLHASNVLPGMLMLEPDLVTPREQGYLYCNDGSGGWSPIAVSREPYTGPVYSLDVDTDHTYVADGVVTHNCYRKEWALTHPRIDADFIMVDEAQDSAGVLVRLIQDQAGHGTQIITVGDSYQAINGWTGAIDAMDKFDGDQLYITQSFRFGHAIAAEANKWLELMGAEKPLRGSDAVTSRLVTDYPTPQAVLCRTNGAVVKEVIDRLTAGQRVAMLGDPKEITDFTRGARDLQDKGWSGHHDLMAFGSWAQVQEYVAHDDAGADLKVMVDLIDKHGVDVIESAMGRLATPARADVVLSTAHKCKGAEWDAVRIGGDFKAPKPDEVTKKIIVPRDAAMLNYVAVTRAKTVLDRGSLAWVDDALADHLGGRAARRPAPAPAEPVVLGPADDPDVIGRFDTTPKPAQPGDTLGPHVVVAMDDGRTGTIMPLNLDALPGRSPVARCILIEAAHTPIVLDGPAAPEPVAETGADTARFDEALRVSAEGTEDEKRAMFGTPTPMVLARMAAKKTPPAGESFEAPVDPHLAETAAPAPKATPAEPVKCGATHKTWLNTTCRLAPHGPEVLHHDVGIEWDDSKCKTLGVAPANA